MPASLWDGEQAGRGVWASRKSQARLCFVGCLVSILGRRLDRHGCLRTGILLCVWPDSLILPLPSPHSVEYSLSPSRCTRGQCNTSSGVVYPVGAALSNDRPTFSVFSLFPFFLLPVHTPSTKTSPHAPTPKIPSLSSSGVCQSGPSLLLAGWLATGWLLALTPPSAPLLGFPLCHPVSLFSLSSPFPFPLFPFFFFPFFSFPSPFLIHRGRSRRHIFLALFVVSFFSCFSFLSLILHSFICSHHSHSLICKTLRSVTAQDSRFPPRPLISASISLHSFGLTFNFISSTTSLFW